MRTCLLLALLLVFGAGCAAPGSSGPSSNPDQPPAAADDLNDGADVDLLETGFNQSWTFDYAQGGSGNFDVSLRTRMQGLVQPSACVTWTRTFSGSESTGNSGDCSGGGNLGLVFGGGALLDDEKQVFHLGTENLVEGHYQIRVVAPPQANRLVISIAIDNPPNAAPA